MEAESQAIIRLSALRCAAGLTATAKSNLVVTIEPPPTLAQGSHT